MGTHRRGLLQHDADRARTAYAAPAFFQKRPLWGQKNNYFSELAGRPKPESVYYLGGGGVGGPIVRNKTFFCFASENYHDVQSRSVSTAFRPPPSARGDFSKLINRRGQPVDDLRPADEAAVSGQRDSGQSHQPSPLRSPATCRCPTLMSTTARTTTRGPRRSTTISSRNTPSRRSTSSPTRCR